MSNAVGEQLLDPLLTLDEVADMLRVPVSTMRKWRSGGGGPRGFRVGKYVRFRRTAVEEFIQEREAAQEADQ
ncbi:helix-turn-helix domain-containing protein [Actinoplanes sp. NPDC020271]|uniref:helix-turn-helix domain-containing protein n=1 Tax=Actinoplanes sp. NPDC020271 TaxID=3363896 RepID=UPI00378FECFE